jgi:4-amino-4-deoxy-L-arabinose transferase-like glycosyltransferase
LAALVLQHRLDTVLHRQFLVEGDANGYWRLAETIVRGEPYAVYDPPRRVLRMPGFPLLLSLPLALTGESTLAARLVLAAVGATACGLTWLLGRQLFGAAAGLLAGAYTAVSPLLVGFSVLVLSETTFAAAMLASLCAAVALWRRQTETASVHSQCLWAALTGALVGVTTLVRPTWLPVAAVMAVVCLVRGRLRGRAWLVAGMLSAATALVLLPWTLRNRHVTGHFVVTTLWSGPSLYDGLHPGATGASDMRFFEDDSLMAREGLDEYTMNQVYWQRAVDFARQNPDRVVDLAVAKLAKFWSPWPQANVADHWLARAVGAAFFVPLVVGAAWGAWRWRREPLRLLPSWGPVLFFAAVHAVFVGSVRYRVPAEFPLSTVAAAVCTCGKCKVRSAN